MKNFILLLAFALLSFNLSAQGTFWRRLTHQNIYRSRVDFEVEKLSDKNYKLPKKEKFLVENPRGTNGYYYIDYKIVSEDDNGAYIKILPTFIETENVDNNTQFRCIEHTIDTVLVKDRNNAYQNYYFFKKEDFNPLTKILVQEKLVGIPLVHPFKLRSNAANKGPVLNTEFTVSYNFGFRLKLNHNPFKQNFVNFIFYGFGVGESKYLNAEMAEEKDAAAVTYYQGGVLFTLQKVNIGAFVGYDAMIGKRNDWIYQSKPWFSLGFGYKFKED